MKKTTLDAGNDNVTRSYNDVNQSVQGSILMFQQIRVMVPSLGNDVSAHLIFSGRWIMI
jgi:hypothetical protein